MDSEAGDHNGQEVKQTDTKSFSIGGKCLAFHGPLLYEAKILRMWNPLDQTLIEDESSVHSKGGNSTEDHENETYPPETVRDQHNYFIHYQGWKSTWDEWIGMDRIREYNDENIALRKKLAQEARDNKKLKQQDSKKRKNGSGNSQTGVSDSNKRRNTQSPGIHTKDGISRKSSFYNQTGSRYSKDDINVTEDNTKKSSHNSGTSLSNNQDTNQFENNHSKLVLHIPVKLKAKLVDDWELVTKDKRICTLPAKVTIHQLLNTYKTQTTKHMSLAEQCQLNEFASGLVDYFEDALSRLLLYRLERLQYEILLKQYKDKNENLNKCDVYGPLHLLRLISILPELISATTMDLQSCQLIMKQCERLLLWMTIHIDTLFPTLNPRENTDLLCNNEKGYENTSSQYEGVALGL